MSKRCFFICPLGDEETLIRKRSDQVFYHIIEPAANEYNYGDITRSDLISTPGIITNQIIDHLYNDEEQAYAQNQTQGTNFTQLFSTDKF
jgi:hypothetical protein